MKRKTKKLKKLGEGYPWFGKWSDREAAYSSVTLVTEMNGDKPVPLKIYDLGAYQKVRLYVEVVE